MDDDRFRKMVPGEKYTHEQAIALVDDPDPRDAIRSGIARGDLMLTNDWKVVRRGR